MAVKTYRLGAGNDGNFAALFEADQTAASRADGWTVAKIAATNQSDFDVGVKQASGTFAISAKPASFLIDTTANAFKAPAALNGSFANTVWTFTFAVRATLASAQAGRVRMRVFRSVNADGSGATEITGATQVGTTSSALSTSADVTSTVTWSPGALTLNNEYLFFVIAWEITTASGSNSGDVVPRTGQSAAGSRIVTPDFTAATITPISGTDSNSTTTESGSAKALIPVVDANSATSENTSEITALSSADAATALDSTFVALPPDAFRMRASTVRGVDTLRGLSVVPTTYSSSDSGSASEITALAARPQFSDAGSASEVLSLVARPAGTEAGTSSETAALSAVYTGTDTGTTSESAFVSAVAQISASDSALAAEAVLLVAKPITSETSGISETVAQVAALPAVDSGIASDSGSVSVGVLQVNGTDSGAGADAGTLVAKATAIDTSGVSETALVALTSADFGTAAEVISRSAQVASSDTGAAIEAASTGVIRNGTDSGVMTDAASVFTASVASADFVLPVEAASVISTPVSPDSGTASESASVQQRFSVSATDSAGASESVSQVVGVSGGVQTGQGAENASQSAREASSDTGTAQEIGLIRFLLVPTLDQSWSDDAELLHAQFTNSDLGTFTEATLITKTVIEVGISYIMRGALLDVGLGNGRMVTVSKSLGSSTLMSVGLSSDEATQVDNLGRATLMKVG